MRISTGSPPRRRVGGAVPAVLVAAVLLAGCAGDGGRQRVASGSSSAPAGSTTPADLSTGLLRAESFGPGSTVVALSREQLGAGTGLGAIAKDLTITPEACAGAVRGTQPDLSAFDDVAGVSATSGSDVTAEILLRGGPTEGAVTQLTAAATRCPEAQLSSDQLGQVTVRFEPLRVPDLGDGAAAVRYTTSVVLPDGTTTTVPALLGAVEDGDRLVVLTSLAPRAGADPAPALDPGAFGRLLEEAYRVQADAFG